MLKKLTRRKFLYLSSLSAMSLATGCATNPVSGKSQLFMISQEQEISIDKKNSPYQFSNDYGITQDKDLNSYLQQTGHKLAQISHRPTLPYSFKCVNATYINAYAFPGGNIAVTRGILLTLENEAELAALLGHEIGHVNARHTAQQMSKGTLIQLLVGGISAYAGSKNTTYGQLASQLGGLGASALLASYSRDNERQADELAIEYMVKAGYNPSGVVHLMTMLNNTSKHKPSLLELMFSTHPMSQERLDSARNNINNNYNHASNLPTLRDRYMDNTARLRSKKKLIELIQEGEENLANKKYQQAENYLANAIRVSPEDYTALTIMAKCYLFQKKNELASQYAKEAKSAYPGEAQACLISGLAHIQMKKFDTALADFTAYDSTLPGNPTIQFYKGLAYEGKQQIAEAAQHFQAYLQSVKQGNQAQYAYKRLVEWGYIQQEQK